MYSIDRPVVFLNGDNVQKALVDNKDVAKLLPVLKGNISEVQEQIAKNKNNTDSYYLSFDNKDVKMEMMQIITHENMSVKFSSSIEIPGQLKVGQTINTVITMTNTGNQVFNGLDTATTLQIGLSYHWYNADGSEYKYENYRGYLNTTLTPNESIPMSLSITAPDKPGDYILSLDAVQEGNAWFSVYNNNKYNYKITVTN